MISTEGASHGASNLTVEREVAHFLATGESDPMGSGFPGSSIIERLTNHERCLREALLQEVERRERGHRQHYMPEAFDPVDWTRRKVQPMIAGLFPEVEQEVVLGVAERSIVFLTPGAAHQAIRETMFLSSARLSVCHSHAPKSGCWKSVLPNARPLLTPARPTGAF